MPIITCSDLRAGTMIPLLSIIMKGVHHGLSTHTPQSRGLRKVETPV